MAATGARGAAAVPAGGLSTAQQTACAECGEAFTPRRNGGKSCKQRFCSDSCRSRQVGAKFRERKRVMGSEAILHPRELQRPFRTDESEPDWLAEELAPPKLACETEPESTLPLGIQ
jgi:hypothetical protein